MCARGAERKRLTGSAGPMGASSGRGREDGRQDARGDTKGGEGRPQREREHLLERRSATGRVGRRVDERERSKKTNGGVKKWKDISSGAVRGRVGDGSRIK